MGWLWSREFTKNDVKRMKVAGDVDGLIKAMEILSENLDKTGTNFETAEDAVNALVDIGDARAVQPLIKALGDENTSKWLFMETTSNDVFFSCTIAWALGRIGDERAVEPLINALKNFYVAHSQRSGLPGRVDNDLRTAAAVALGSIGDERAVEPLIYALSSDHSDVQRNNDGTRKQSVISSAAAALGEIGDERAIIPLIMLFVETKKPIVKEKPISLTANFGRVQSEKEAKESLDYIDHLTADMEYDAIAHALDGFLDWEGGQTKSNVETEFVRLELYDKAEEWYTFHGRLEEAAAMRRQKEEMGTSKVEQTVIHGDYVDDRDTIVKDSVINRSNVGAGSDDKIAKLEKIAEMKDKGIIDDDEFKQMKKEILGK